MAQPDPDATATERLLEQTRTGQVEVTPKAIRLRKMLLKESDRRKQARQAAN
ncbi:MAG TPA: hypothetical protein VEL76_03470 [Gemmataceae bacterium]|nr:hypothetical protein [Gemmataceae bacterium]